MTLDLLSNTDSPESILRRREQLKIGFGIALCTRQKEGGNAALEQQTLLAESLDLPSVQFDFRHRTAEEILAAKEILIKYRETHPEAVISVHGETPEIDELTLDFKNKQRILDELSLLLSISGESYTVHPPSVSAKIFNEAPAATKEKVIKNYAEIFALKIKEAFESEKKFSLAVENMPNKGAEGAWGQTVEDILGLVQNIEQAVIELGLPVDVAKEYVGVTFDVNHALHGLEAGDYESVLRAWFQSLGEYLKVVHLYTPSELDASYREKYKLTLDLVSQFCPNAKLFMETKQSEDTTRQVYNFTKQLEV